MPGSTPPQQPSSQYSARWIWKRLLPLLLSMLRAISLACQDAKQLGTVATSTEAADPQGEEKDPNIGFGMLDQARGRPL